MRNFDTELDLPKDSAPTIPFRCFGADWHLDTDVNAFTLSELSTGDTNALVTFIGGMIVEDEREAFLAALREVKGMNGERLGKLVGLMIEEASERPTQQPSASSRTASKRTSSPKSRAVTSRR